MSYFAAFFLITLPWLNPFAPGPSPAVVPLLFSWICAAVLFVAYRQSRERSAGAYLDGAISWGWLLAGLLSAAMGLAQYLGAAGSLHQWVSQADLGQAFANLRQRNQFASLTSISMAALIWFCVRAPLAKHHQWLVWLAAGLLAAGNAASSSRTGLVQLFMLCTLAGVWGVWRQRLVLSVLLISVVVYVAAVLLLPSLAGLDPALHGLAARLRTGDDACSSRLTLWSNVLHLIAQKPWLGWGWGELDYAHYITLYDGARFCDILDNAHNLPLHLAVELGIPVALVVCGALVWWVCSQRPWNERQPARQLAWAVLALIGLHSLLEYPLWYGPFQMAVGLCVYLLWRNPREAAETLKTPKYAPNRAVAPVLWAFVATFVIAFCAYAAWDYRRVSQIYLATDARDADYRDDTLSKIRDSKLFRNQVLFAELSLTPLTPSNAQWTFVTASALLHFSPEPKVIEKLIESATMLGDDQTALFQLARFRVAFPQDYQKWSDLNKHPKVQPQKL